MDKESTYKKYEKRYKIRSWIMDRVNRHITMKYWGFETKLYIYGGKILHRADKINTIITKGLLSDEPFMVSRFGGTEINVMNAVKHREVLGESQDNTKEFDKWFWRLQQWCGFFPDEPSLMERFSDLIKDSAQQADVLGVWNRPMEDYMLKYYMPNTKITYLRWLEPWYAKKAEPWTSALAGKNVLVIHPFDESIKAQYENRDKVFADIDKTILPDFNLITMKAVQTIAGCTDDRFSDWFEALQYMYDEAMKVDFDVAIIGCGAYGMPLAAMLKEAGKKAIHLGGVTQCLFGIKGSRWVNSPIDKAIPINEHWIYPSENETPKAANVVENACYWK